VWLAICDPADAAGRWAVAGLRRRGLPIELIAPDEVFLGVRLVHRVTRAGSQLALETRSGLIVRGDALRGVLNRMLTVPAGAVAAVAPGDRAYVAEELEAAVTSWMAGLACPVLNRPSPGLLFGRSYPAARWRQLGAAVGLPTAPWRFVTNEQPEPPAQEAHTTAVIGDDVIDPPEPELALAARELVRRAGLGVAGLSFGAAAGGWQLLDATSLPDLRRHGDSGLAALERALTLA
jgi:hypothetical protein